MDHEDYDHEDYDHEGDHQAVRTAKGESGPPRPPRLKPQNLSGAELRLIDRKWRVNTVAAFVLQQGTDSVDARLGVDCEYDEEVVAFIQEHCGAYWCIKDISDLPTEE
jgi:hypothetical protein